MSLMALLALSALAYFKLPVSLLPEADVPEISIIISYPNGAPEEIESNALKPIRESMLTLNGLKEALSLAQNQAGKVTLRFEYETSMSLAYIEVNEKIDRLAQRFPVGMDRPVVIKSTTSDIPIIRVQITPKREEDLLAASQLAYNVLKRRLEQLDGVGLVDMNGLLKEVIRIDPDQVLMNRLGLTNNDIIKTIETANLSLGAISVHDGNYRYFVKLTSRVNSPAELGLLPVTLPDGTGHLALQQIANISTGVEKATGYHLVNSSPGIVIAVHKQARTKLPDLIPELTKTVEQFNADYPQFNFSLTQDQSLLLHLSIQNLSQAVVWGGAFAFGVLFLFMRGWREPLIMGIVLPLSLMLAFSLFYLFDLSLNIVSLSGLVLGLGMLVDNSIVVIDNIILKRKEGSDLTESCVTGTREVMAPLLSSALTNMAVFLPLVFMSGLTGTLFYDQAVSVAAILTVSLLCTFIVVPLLYSLFFKNRKESLQEDSRIFHTLKDKYEKSFLTAWNHKKTTLVAFCLLVPIAVFILFRLPIQGFPDIERTETVLSINWNAPIDADQCRQQVVKLLDDHAEYIKASEAEIGFQQFMFNSQSTIPQQALIYILYGSKREKEIGDQLIRNYLSRLYPQARYNLTPAPNAFEQLFSSNQPTLDVRFRDMHTKKPIDMAVADSLLNEIKLKYRVGEGFETETMINIQLNKIKLVTYGIDPSEIIRQLKITFGDYLITDFRNFGETIPVIFNQASGDFESILQQMTIRSSDGTTYPLKEFIGFSYHKDYKAITADESGIYQSIELEDVDNFRKLQNELTLVAKAKSLVVDYAGQWFEDRKILKQLTLILLVSLVLMYFILTTEFESLSQPLLVMASFPVGFAGSIILLWISGGSINIMSGIGLVVVLGILDNDAILKVDRINRLRKTLPLTEAIVQAGKDRFKPIVMNTCTNVLALTPIVFASGLGADLQRPVAITTIGGLIVGTLTALYFVPLVYWYMSRRN